MPKKPTTEGRLKRATRAKSKRLRPVWGGPEKDGVTQSLLSKFLVCRERFRLLTVEGLREAPSFRVGIEYGNMWHLCEECHAAGEPWETVLRRHAAGLAKEYRGQQDQVEKWYQVCRRQFPVYVEYWSRHPDVMKRKLIAREHSFKVPYVLGSGRRVFLRGKWDSVDVVKTKPAAKGKIILQENKTTGDIDEQKIASRLTFDLQTGLYLVALTEAFGEQSSHLRDRLNGAKASVAGVRYNVVRRPLSGGKGSIRPHKATKNKPAESADHFYGRLQAIMEEDPGPDYFFMRWDVEITQKDLQRFRTQCLDPTLEALCDWWEWVAADPDDPWRQECDTGKVGNGVHFRFPYGVWNPVSNGVMTEVDQYMANGSTSGLTEVKTLYPELEERDAEGDQD